MKISADDLVDSAEMASPRSPAEDLPPLLDLPTEIPKEQKKITQYFHYINKGVKRLKPSFDMFILGEPQRNHNGQKSGDVSSGERTPAERPASSIKKLHLPKATDQESTFDDSRRSTSTNKPDDRYASSSMQRRQTSSSPTMTAFSCDRPFRGQGGSHPIVTASDVGKNDDDTLGYDDDTLGYDDCIDDDEDIKQILSSDLPRPWRKVACTDATSDDDDDDKVQETRLNKNLEFYMNTRMSKPNGDYINVILNRWRCNYEKLEDHHGYIQWLFPIKESGTNDCAQVLQEHEAKAIRENLNLRKRVLDAYEMMLNFYGLRLIDDATGVVGPATDRSHFNKRMKHLNSSSHNYLRITRILKSLGELGFERLKKPLVEHLMDQVFATKLLNNCRQSCIDFWIPSLANKEDRERLQAKAKEVMDKAQKYTIF